MFADHERPFGLRRPAARDVRDRRARLLQHADDRLAGAQPLPDLRGDPQAGTHGQNEIDLRAEPDGAQPLPERDALPFAHVQNNLADEP